MPRLVVVGGGITGLTTAYRLRQLLPDADIAVRETDDRLGGKIRSSAFAGVDGVDEAADAFLTRVPFAMKLATELGLGDDLTSPAVAAANVWWNGLHPIPEGLLLGVPTDISKLARTRLLTWRGKARAGLEPILPGNIVGVDSVGTVIRRRFGDEVQERLVDPLVGSIYAADTDRFSLAGVPQISDLATKHRSLLLGARSMRRNAPRVEGPIFATPRAGMAAMIDALAQSLDKAGVDVRTGSPVSSIERAGRHYVVDGEAVDAIALATPARVTGPLLRDVSPDAATALAGFDHAGVVMVTMNVLATEWPGELHRFSGYLIPKPVQDWVTAVSFASSKWAHWRAVDGQGRRGMILRVSLGRDGHDLTDRSDDELLDHAVTEVGRHLDLSLQPEQTRITRWPMAFPQYRPGHAARVDALESTLRRDAPGLFVTGASYRGIGIPACIQQASATAASMAALMSAVRD